MAVDFWLLRSMAEQGDAAAQYCLGIMYQQGCLMYKGTRVVPQDMAEALKWLRKAAEQVQTGNILYIFNWEHGLRFVVGQTHERKPL